MVQNNRQLMRLFFILVLVAAMLGWWYASTFWQFDATSMFINPETEEGGDWVDVMAALADRMLLLFLDLASPNA